MKTLVICTAMSAMILCACGGKNTQSTEDSYVVLMVRLYLGDQSIGLTKRKLRLRRSFLTVRQRKVGVERTKTLSRITDGW